MGEVRHHRLAAAQVLTGEVFRKKPVEGKAAEGRGPEKEKAPAEDLCGSLERMRPCYRLFPDTGGRFSQAAVPQSGIVERLCLKLPVTSLVE